MSPLATFLLLVGLAPTILWILDVRKRTNYELREQQRIADNMAAEQMELRRLASLSTSHWSD